ncbi:E3 ubiquitin-protein ligase TRIM47-like isoform X2 [Esox lucius]|uniref:E3 ubiquitin-protein ligase TRIM47-like isoform X2 n=1 Tax=Esox lucius TaxID=8010 RepID=UPI0014771DD4|nr:E3 ubiquitin-protein ligase TRIM47-like isoform X2 [Esox lucius]
MADAVSSIRCSICLDPLKDPVTIPCGHSYCMSCIKDCLDKEDDKGIYSCPICRQTFLQRPALNRSTILSQLVENLKETRRQAAPPDHYYAAPPDHYYAGPGDVECDFCTGTKFKAVKSCLMCLASYCETHLQPHFESPAFKKHKLVKASKQLQEMICSHHDKLLEIYCRTDQQCICYLCTMDEHKGHDTVSALAERTEKEKQLGEKHMKSRKRIQEREKEIQELRWNVDLLKHSAQAVVKDSGRIVTELIHSIRAQEKTEVSRTEGLLEQLEKEVSEMRRRDVELKQLSHIEDHIHFLQSLCVSPECKASTSINVNPHISFEHVKKSVSELIDQLQDVFKKEMDKMSGKATTVQTEPPAGPKTREDFLTYSCQLTLDPNTANQFLCLSEGNRKVTCSEVERFTFYYQVLCRESLTGLCYWEVEWSGFWVHVAVSYKEMISNDQSWILYCSTSGCCFYYNNNRTDIPVPCSSRVGVYLDHRAGSLSFYSVSDTMTLLHRVQTTFTQPLYAGFSVYKGLSVKILTPIQ